MRQIEVFADVACPFTHVGLRRLIAERDAGGAPTSCCGCGPGRWNS
jgi:hypothetical protein